MSFAEELAKLANLGILDHDGSLLGFRGNHIVNRRARGGGNSNCRWAGILIVADHLTTLGSSEGPVATGEPGKAAASDDLPSPVPPRADATGAEETGSRSPSPKPRNPVVLSQISLNIPSTGASRGD